MSDILHCATKFRQHCRIAHTAPFPEAAEMHWQMAMLYKAQFRLLKARLRKS
jgi:hypothetical protein